MWAQNEVYMASIYIRSDSRDIRKYYGSINHNNLHIRKYLGLTKKNSMGLFIKKEKLEGRG